MLKREVNYGWVAGRSCENCFFGQEAGFEDAHLAAAGKEAGAEIVVTRNEQGFVGGILTPYGPESTISMIRS